ncbi:MAG: hypothetical protein K8S99_04165 [Planctomycetes bacterium]|nr:hypothetical protein [Planctomycetota bacterium]
MPQPAVIIVDHGSRRAESNDMLLQVVELFRGHGGAKFPIVEPAHMELAEPSIATAFDRCVERGAGRVVVMPYFLLPGRHWDQDIPRLTAQAAQKHPGVEFLVAAPLGLHPLIADVIGSRIDHCLAHVAGNVPECDVCTGTGRCVLHGNPSQAR